ncbi:MAG: aconitase/3-isopropylmalate dehydratase large subunit family protein, partial [Spirochaetota bacterium]|nr:aconitase/3-isopropylmalate dehydratase large subunit family protein [Spirochaetota bacterium]
MAMTITEKILAKKSGRSKVNPGENVWVDVDVLMTHDVCGPGTIAVFKENFGENAKVWDKDKLVIIPDHYIFTEDVKCNRNVDILRDFVKEQDIKYFYDPGTASYKGVCHVALAQEGHTRPGEVMFGTDSHTCTAGAFGQFATGIGNTEAGFIMGAGRLWVKVPETMKFVFEGELPPYLMAKDLILRIIGDIGVDGATYRTMEFAGDGVYSLEIEERMTLCNMAIEGGGKNGVIAPDELTLDFVKARTDKPFEVFHNDDDAGYHSVRTYQSKDIEPVVAKPHSPDNKALARELKDVKIDQAYIGSCTGGKLADYKAAAALLRGKTVKTRTVIIPATQEVYEGLKTETLGG